MVTPYHYINLITLKLFENDTKVFQKLMKPIRKQYDSKNRHLS